MIFLIGLGFILGMVLGSFGLAMADRSLGNKSFWGRSYCPFCKHKLGWYDLFPVFSYLFLKGHCRYCHKKIPLEYVLTEVFMGVLIAFLFWQTSTSLNILHNLDNQYYGINFVYELISKAFIITVLVTVAITDLKKTIIPDRITYPSIVLTLLMLVGISTYKVFYYYNELKTNQLGNLLLTHTNYFVKHAFWDGNPLANLTIIDPLLNGILMAIVIGLFFLSLIILTKGRGMGGGDFKLGILLGLFFGFPNAIIVIMLAFFIGSLFAVTLLLLQRKHFGQTIPFGPFLSLAGIITLFWGPQILNWYLHLQLP